MRITMMIIRYMFCLGGPFLRMRLKCPVAFPIGTRIMCIAFRYVYVYNRCISLYIYI